jgi:hypothetical protein
MTFSAAMSRVTFTGTSRGVGVGASQAAVWPISFEEYAGHWQLGTAHREVEEGAQRHAQPHGSWTSALATRVQNHSKPCRTHPYSLSQHSYIDSILTRYNFNDLKPSFIPMDPNVLLSVTQCATKLKDITKMRNVPYREAVGSFMYAAM